MLLTIWAGVGYYSVIFVAGLQNIPEELYDAARIDGCNDLQKHWHVSLPGLRPQITFVAVISSLAALKVFDEIYVLTGKTGGILDSGVTIVFYLWKQAFVLGHAGYASADRDGAARDHARVLGRQRALPRARAGRGVSGTSETRALETPVARRNQRSRVRWRRTAGTHRLVRDPAGDRVHHGVPVRLDVADVDQGPGRPDHVRAAAVLPQRPDHRELPAGARQPADPGVLREQRDRVGHDQPAQRAGRLAGRLSAGQDAVRRPERDLLRTAGDADRPRPAHVHPELRARRERLPLLRHAGGADLPGPRVGVQHLPAAPGVPGRPERPHGRRAGGRRRRVPDLVADHDADRPAVARRRSRSSRS